MAYRYSVFPFPLWKGKNPVCLHLALNKRKPHFLAKKSLRKEIILFKPGRVNVAHECSQKGY